MSVAARYQEWTDAELQAEEKRLITLYPSIRHPLSPEVDADMTRLLEVQIATFERKGGTCIFQPYYPMVIHDQINIDDLKNQP